MLLLHYFSFIFSLNCFNYVRAIRSVGGLILILHIFYLPLMNPDRFRSICSSTLGGWYAGLSVVIPSNPNDANEEQKRVNSAVQARIEAMFASVEAESGTPGECAAAILPVMTQIITHLEHSRESCTLSLPNPTHRCPNDVSLTSY